LIDDFDFYVGIDMAAEKHQACIVNRTGKVVGELGFEHSGAGLIDFIRSLEKLTGSLATRVGIVLETPRGPIVECVLERGYSVFSINPKQLDRFRDRHTVAGAKDDRRDAFVLADSLRTDLPLFRRLQQESAAIIRLRELSRLEDDRCKIIFGLSISCGNSCIATSRNSSSSALLRKIRGYGI